jgi:hypothetical protein
MNDSFGRGRSPRPPWRRRARAVAAVTAMASTALLAAACGGGSPSPAAGSTRFDKALAYSQCMRSHGLPNFPDPNSPGQLPQLQMGRNGVAQQAQNACRHLQESYLMSGGQMTGEQQQHALSQLVKYAACMRGHGEPNFPDPTAGNGGIGFGSQTSGPNSDIGPGVDPKSPQFQAAQQACKPLASKARG